MPNIDGRRFTLVSNSAGDAKPGETIFIFEQEGSSVRATYEGGGVQLGAIVGQFEEDGSLFVLFQQVTTNRRLCGGEGKIQIEEGEGGKLRFVDDWRFTYNGEGNGRAIWQEL